MKKPWLVLLLGLLAGCSSAGTESGNPTRGGCEGTQCAPCPPPITLQVTDSVSGAAIGAAITVDGQVLTCSVLNGSSVCSISGPSYAVAGERQLVVSAGGHAAKTISVEVPAAPESGCCECSSGSVVVPITLDPSA